MQAAVAHTHSGGLVIEQRHQMHTREMTSRLRPSVGEVPVVLEVLSWPSGWSLGSATTRKVRGHTRQAAALTTEAEHALGRLDAQMATRHERGSCASRSARHKTCEAARLAATRKERRLKEVHSRICSGLVLALSARRCADACAAYCFTATAFCKTQRAETRH